MLRGSDRNCPSHRLFHEQSWGSVRAHQPEHGDQNMLTTGARFIAKNWIEQHNKPTGHDWKCECSSCQMQMAAQFMGMLIIQSQRDKATIRSIQEASAASIRAYRASLR